MKKSIVLGLTATLLTFGPLVAGVKPQSKVAKPASLASQTMQKQQPGTTTQSTTTPSTTTTKSGKKANVSSNRIHKETGMVDTVSSSELAITTKSGTKDTFMLESSTKNASSAKTGDRVTVWYRESNGQKMATRIAVNHGSAAVSKKSTSTSASSTKAKGQKSTATEHH